MCPYLVNIVADRLCLYPTAIYCRRPGARIRFPLRSTLLDICTTPLFARCAGYRAASERGAGETERSVDTVTRPRSVDRPGRRAD